jgi:Tol biopolymer transport system component
MLYDVGRDEATDYLVMEYLEGETLGKRLEKGPLPVKPLLRTAIEVSDALDKAHRRGVIHRDLKPGNIMLTPQSGAKVLDFGLAKSAAALAPASMLTATPTQSSPLTAEGTIVGTFQYMAPEQLEGKEADARSDIFAFGAVLYEMATAKKAFPGKSQFSVASAILEKDPEPLCAVQPMTPPALERVVKRCLAKDPEDRWQTARDLTVELNWISEAGAVLPESTPATMRTSPLQMISWVAAAIFLALATVLGLAYYRATSISVRPVRSSILPLEKSTFNFGGGFGGPALSPDGTRVVYPARDASGKDMLWIRPLDSLTARPLEGTEDGAYPFWSPDGRFLGFFTEGKLKKIDVSGGPPQAICDAPNGRGGTWNRDNLIVFAPDIESPLARVAAAGGGASPLTRLDESRHETSHRLPSFLPDGRHVIYWGGNPSATANVTTNGIYLLSLDSAEPKLLVKADSNALYAHPGYLLFQREQSLMAQRFDAGSLKLTGDAFPIAEQVANPQLFRLGLFSASQTGVIVYQAGAVILNQFLWLDSSGKRAGTVGEPGDQGLPHLSPDGGRLAYIVQDAQSRNIDIWLTDLARGVRTRFTFDPAIDNEPAWSPDGNRIVFASDRKGHYDLYVKDASGAGTEQPLFESEADKAPTDWSRDGRYIAFELEDPKGKNRNDIWVFPLFGDRKPFPFLQTQFDELHAVFSPDGHWLAYESNESGKYEVYIAPFPGAGGKWQVSQGGGVQPQWSRDGASLFFLASGGKFMQVGVKAKGSAMDIGIPRQLFEARSIAQGGPLGHAYSVAPDGRRFLFNMAQEGGNAVPLTLVVNWTAELKK